MRSIWKGSIAFGLVNVPVKLYSATEDHDVDLHQVHDKDRGRIRYQRRCDVCGRIVDFDHIDKAYEEGDRTVILTDDDLSSLPEERSREIEVVEFVPSDQVDPIMFDRSYFLEPDSKSSKAYVLLRRTLEETERTAIVHFALRQKTRLGALSVRGEVLMRLPCRPGSSTVFPCSGGSSCSGSSVAERPSFILCSLCRVTDAGLLRVVDEQDAEFRFR
jgi:DNA end-binding protein Ku